MILICLQKTHDLRCSTRLLHDKFQNMSNGKKVIVQELGFDGLMHIPPMNVLHKLLNELAYSFDLIRNTLDTRYGVLRINQENIRAALGLNASGALFLGKVNFKELSEEDKEVYRNFQEKILKQLTDSTMETGVDGDKDQLRFKRTFILYIQMLFLLPTIINKHLTKELLLERIEAEIKGNMDIVKRTQLKEKLTRMKEEEKKEKKKKTQKKKDTFSESNSGTDSESDSEQD
ncbi:hypothetical protein AHAS_Ahas19G0221100 [Arachis hypogaea]